MKRFIRGAFVLTWICLVPAIMVAQQTQPAGQQSPPTGKPAPELKQNFVDKTFKYNDDHVLVQAQVFEILGRDVRKVREYFEQNTPFRTTDEQYLKYCVRQRLFLLEGKASGQFDEENILDLPMEEKVALQKRYISQLTDASEVDDATIASYYHAFPRRFMKESTDTPGEEATQSKGPEPQAGPNGNEPSKPQPSPSDSEKHTAPQNGEPEIATPEEPPSHLQGPDSKGSTANRGLIKDKQIPADQLRPLNGTVRRMIGKFIMQSYSEKLIDKEYERLVEKYNVQFK